MKKVWKVLFCILCAIHVLPLQLLSAIELEYEIIDDIDNRISYSAGNANQGGWESWGEGAPEITEHWSNSAGAVAEIRFEGTKFELYGKKHPSHAMFSVQINDEEPIECDAYAESTEKEAKLFESKELQAGEHKAKITVLNKRNVNSTGTGNIFGVQFVYAKAYQTVLHMPQPILYYDFNEHNAEDKAGDYNGTLVNDPTFTTGQTELGDALDTSQGGYVELAEDVSLGKQDFTVAFYVKSQEEKNDTVLFANKTADSGRDHGFSICNYDGVFGNAGYDNVRYDTSSYDRDRSVLDGSWRHVVVTAERDNKLSLYVDGVLSNENTDFKELANISLDTEGRYVLGAGNTGKYLQKALYDEFKLFDTALTPDEVMYLYDSYGGDKQAELDKAMALISDGENIKVSQGADKEMKINAIKKYVKESIDQYKSININVESMEDDQYQIQLTKAGKTISKTFSFVFHEKDTLTIATYNIYGWGYPNMKDISDKLDSLDVDIAGLQEANYQTNGNGQVTQLTAQGIYQYSAFKEGYGTDTIWGGSTLVSKYPLREIGGANYEVNDRTNRSYVRSIIDVGDKEVALYNTHIVWLEDSELYAEYKEAQINELLQAIEEDETPYKIITGDFNTDQSIEELDQLLLHLNSANGWQNTWYETCDKDASMKIGSVDQIFTTTNIEFADINVMDGGQSDHDILYADLILKEEEAGLPRQLLDNTLLEAEKYLVNAELYELDKIAQLKHVKNTILEEPVTKDNLYQSVQRLREAINSLVEKIEPIGEPLLYYNFDNHTAEDIASDYHGTLKENPTFEKGMFGDALTTGDGFVEIPKTFELSNKDFTISFWLKTKEQKQDTVIFSNKSGDSGNEKGFFICNYNGLYGNVGDGNKRYDTSSDQRDDTAVNGEWHLITVSADRSDSLSLYVDGIKSASNPKFKEIESLLLDTEDAYIIGAGSKGGYRQKANIDEFKIYDAALDEQQVDHIYKQYMKQDMGYRDILEGVIIKAETLVSSDQFTILAPNVKALIKGNLDAAKTVYEDMSASNTQCLEAWKNLADALHYADFKADKTQLEALIEVCDLINVTDYEEGVDEFLEALLSAKEVYKNADVLQDTIDDAFDKLTLAKAGLKEKPSDEVQKDMLSYMIELANKVIVSQDKYLHNESWRLFEACQSDAKRVLNDSEADQKTVDKAVYDLAQAYENIRLLPDEEMLNKLESFIKVTMNINRSDFQIDELEFIDKSVEQAKTMLKSKAFTTAEFQAFSNTMNGVMTIINTKQIDQSYDHLIIMNEGNTTKVETYRNMKNPQTSDKTSVVNLFGLMALGGMMMVVSRKRR